MMRAIYFHGRLRETLGVARAECEANSVASAVRFLCHQIKGLRRELAQGFYRVVCTKGRVQLDLGEEHLAVPLGAGDVHIVPVVAGSGPFIKMILGAALIAAAFVTGQVGLGIMGASMIIGGTVELLSPKAPTVGGSVSQAAQRKSDLFSNNENVSVQGVPYPLAYGECLLGSIVASAGTTAVRI